MWGVMGGCRAGGLWPGQPRVCGGGSEGISECACSGGGGGVSEDARGEQATVGFKIPPPPGKASPVKAAGTGRAVGRAAQPEFPQVVEEEEEAGGRT